MLAFIAEPCDESVIRSAPAAAPCSKRAGRWVLVATILASSMAFIDGTVVNVALPALQANLNATVVDVQWVIEAYASFRGPAAGRRIARRSLRTATDLPTGVAVFALASASCGFAFDIRQLISRAQCRDWARLCWFPAVLPSLAVRFQRANAEARLGLGQVSVP